MTTKAQINHERAEAKRLGILPEFRRRRVLEKALGQAYAAGAFEFLDLCIAQNELNVAWDKVVAGVAKKRRRGKKVLDLTYAQVHPFVVGDEVTVDGCVGHIHKIEGQSAIVRFTITPFPMKGSGVSLGEFSGKIYTKRFTLGSDGTLTNGQFKGPLVKHVSV